MDLRLQEALVLMHPVSTILLGCSIVVELLVMCVYYPLGMGVILRDSESA